MVCGTASDVGKSHVVAGLCRVLARRGVRVAPFKAQNMSLNSWVTATGHEIGRAQGVQALAARTEPEVAMNPVLLKPAGATSSQIVVLGRPVGDMTPAEYRDHAPHLLDTVLDALSDLRRKFDVVLAEGAGSPAEINLAASDIVNLRVAERAGLPAVIVGDIDRGGVFAALYGTMALLPDDQRRMVQGLIVNKFRGDPALLGDGPDQLARLTGVPVLGVVPFLDDVALDAEDSLGLDGIRARPAAEASGDGLDVAVVRFPHLANATDLDALAIEPGVGVRLVRDASALGQPDLVVLPGTKATVEDLAWLRRRGLDRAVRRAADGGATVLGICGGYQVLGHRIVDDVESRAGTVDGLGWLDVTTTFGPEKVTRRRTGVALGQPLAGYQIHHGRTARGPGANPWVHLDDEPHGEPEGATDAEGGVMGTSLHGLFEEDGFRRAFLAGVARRRGRAFVPACVSFAGAREAQFDRIADALEEHLDLAAVESILSGGAHGPVARR